VLVDVFFICCLCGEYSNDFTAKYVTYVQGQRIFIKLSITTYLSTVNCTIVLKFDIRRLMHYGVTDIIIKAQNDLRDVGQA